MTCDLDATNVFFTILVRLEAADDDVNTDESVDLSCTPLLLLLKLYVKLLVPLELLSLPLVWFALRLWLCRIKQYDEFVDFNFDTNSSPESLFSSGVQLSA